MAPRAARANNVDTAPEFEELLIRWAPIEGTVQEEYFDDNTQDGYILLSGGWAAGKTMCLTAKALKLSAINAPLPGIWCVPDYNHIQDTIIPTLTELDPDSVKAGDPQHWFLRPDQFKYHAHATSERPGHCLMWEGGGPIWFVTAENADSIAGPNVAWCATDEPGSISPIAWRNTIARVRHPLATLRQKIAAGTAEGLNYLSDLFGPDRDENYRLYRMRTQDNRELLRHNPGYIEQVTANATDVELAAYLEGLFVNMTGGLAYPKFDPDVQYRSLTENEALPLRISFDFNVDPMSVIIGQQWAGPAGVEFGVLKALALPVSTVDDQCDAILKRYPTWKAGVYVYGDASGKSRNQQTLKPNYAVIKDRLSAMVPKADLYKECVPTQNPPIKRRLLSVNRLCCDARGVTRLFLNGDRMKPRQAPALELARSLQKTIVKPGTDDIWKKPGETISHLADAVGYWLDFEAPAVKPESGVAVIKVAQSSTISDTLARMRAAKTDALRKQLEAGRAKKA